MHKVRIGLKFDDIVYTGDQRDVVLDAPIRTEVVEFIIKHSRKKNVMFYVMSDRLFTFTGRSRMRKWFKRALRDWLLDKGSTSSRFDMAGIHLVPDIQSYMMSDNTILEGLIKTWVDQVADIVHWPIINIYNVDIMIDDISMLGSSLWDTPYLDITV